MNHIGDILSQSGHSAALPPREHMNSTPHSLPPQPMVDHAQPPAPAQPVHAQEPSYSLDFDTPSPSAPVPQLTPAPTVQPEVSSGSSLDVKKMKAMIFSMKDQLNAMLRMLDGELVATTKQSHHEKTQVLETGEKVIEGVFNGQAMVGEDGQEYNVPANYASKSKMVEGDLLKLTVTNKGSYIYKQIGPIDRKRVIGELVADTNNPDHWIVLAEGKTYKVLGASITYYKGSAGDEVVLLVPRSGMSEWGAVDHVIKKQVQSQ